MKMMKTINDVEKELNTTLHKVEYLLKHNKHSRDDDMTLCFLYWLNFENIGKKFNRMEAVFRDYGRHFNIVDRFTKPETITRARRHIQNEMGLYKASQESQRRRIIKQESYREKYKR